MLKHYQKTKSKNLKVLSGTLAFSLATCGIVAGLTSQFVSAAEDSKDVEVQVNLEPFISLAVDQSTLVMNATATQISQSDFIKSTVKATVNTNNSTGYNLYFSDKDTNTNLVHNTIAGTTIPTLDISHDNSTESTFPVNYWGYSLGQGLAPTTDLYHPIPVFDATTKTTIKTSSTPVKDDDTYVTFGTKLDATKPAGTYSDVVTFTAVTTGVPTVTTFEQAYAAAGKTKVDGTHYSMQDMDSTICSNVTTHTSTDDVQTAQVVDTRDGKNTVYWIAKLKDGHCWMTQNLDYDIKGDGTDIISNNDGTTSTWSTSATYPPEATSKLMSSDSSYTGVKSWDPGDCYSTDGAAASITSWSSGSTATCASTTGNQHYHQGNYYQWNAATAGTGGTITSQDATSSICPKGWRLPTSGNASGVSKPYSFRDMITAEGISTSSDTGIRANPLYFVRGGYVYSGSLDYAGTNGRYWSSMAYSLADDAYYLYFRSSDVGPSGGSNRYGGFSIRCVAI